MRGLLSPRAVVVLLATLATPAALAHAETTATTSVAQLMVLEPGDSSYSLFHGAVWLEHDKATTNYRWGGAQCKGRDLSDTSVQLLFAAFRAEYRVRLEYLLSEFDHKTYRCVTGLTVSKP